MLLCRYCRICSSPVSAVTACNGYVFQISCWEQRLPSSFMIISSAQAAGWHSWQAKGGYSQAGQARGKQAGKKGFE